MEGSTDEGGRQSGTQTVNVVMRAWALGLDLLLSSLEASFRALAVLKMHGFEREGRASRDTRLSQATTVSARDSPNTNRIFDRATRPDAITKLNIVRGSILAALFRDFPSAHYSYFWSLDWCLTKSRRYQMSTTVYTFLTCQRLYQVRLAFTASASFLCRASWKTRLTNRKDHEHGFLLLKFALFSKISYQNPNIISNNSRMSYCFRLSHIASLAFSLC